MYMIPFCKIFLLLIYSVKPECKKKKKNQENNLQI